MFYKAFLFSFLFSVSVSAAFFPQTDDIPLMEGLTLQKNIMTFDTPAGQILAYSVKTDKSADEIRSFYHATLTALGWRSVSKDTYTRDSDRFQMTFSEPGTIKFDMTLSGSN